jgi:hypothetical protein
MKANAPVLRAALCKAGIGTWLLCCACLVCTIPAPVFAAGTVFLDEHFGSLDRWQPLLFPNISRHSTYNADRCDAGSCLQMASDNSASALVLRQPFNVYQFPKLAWRWKISNVYQKGDSSTKAGDDYPARLYVMFAYEPEHASLAKRIKYQMAKTLYGQYPPDSSISYIWDNRESQATVITNAYASEAKMIPVSAGPAKVNTWQEYTADIVQDYRRAFGQDPPPTATLAVMNDSDNTGEAAKSWIQYIRILSAP